MKTNISPVVAAIVIVVVLAVGGLLIYSRLSNSAPQYGAEIPDVVAKDAREHGPRPMPPIPMPGGGTMTPQGAAVGAPKTK